MGGVRVGEFGIDAQAGVQDWAPFDGSGLVGRGFFKGVGSGSGNDRVVAVVVVDPEKTT